MLVEHRCSNLRQQQQRCGAGSIVVGGTSSIGGGACGSSGSGSRSGGTSMGSALWSEDPGWAANAFMDCGRAEAKARTSGPAGVHIMAQALGVWAVCMA